MPKLTSIKGRFTWRGKSIKYLWQDSDNFDNLDPLKCQQSYGICFYKGKMIIGRRKKGHWGPIGGHIEKGETFEEALKREIIEESNMRMVKATPIGYQEVYDDSNDSLYQLRFACLVEPIGKFEKDPDGSIDEIKLIDPKSYKKYFNWDKIGDQMMKRALEALKNF